MKKYIHYGSDRFVKELFNKVKNTPYLTKPIGGFWASPVDSTRNWIDFAKSNNIYKNIDGYYDISFEFKISDDAKVLHLYSIDDLDNLPRYECEENKRVAKYNNEIWLDFEKLSEEYDAIELHLSEEKRTSDEFWQDLYHKLYSWDCDSILIMNPDIIIEESV